MKKILFALVLVLVLVGCGKNDTAEPVPGIDDGELGDIGDPCPCQEGLTCTFNVDEPEKGNHCAELPDPIPAPLVPGPTPAEQ